MFIKGTFNFRSLLAYILAALLLLSVAGCEAKDGIKTTGKTEGDRDVFTIADPTGDWGFPSPYSHYARGPGYVRMSFIFDTLVWKDKNGYVPALAGEWVFIEDENAYLFKLRDNVTWHDGKPFTARDVVFTLNYINEHPYQWVDTEVITKAVAVGNHQVKIYLKKPYAPFLEYVAGTLPVLPEHVWKKVRTPENFRQKEALTGTGPYKLIDYNKEQGTYLYQAYENYYLGKPKIKQIKFVKMNPVVVAAAIKQGQVNAAQIPPEIGNELREKGFKIITGNYDWVAKMMINHRKAPLKEKAFRQALAYAIDRHMLVDTCQRGFAVPGSPGLVPPDSDWYSPSVGKKYGYDIKESEKILLGLGYTKSGDYFEKNGKILELELLLSGSGSVYGAPGEQEGEVIKSQLKKAGIKVNIRGLEAKTLDNRVGEWEFDLALNGHGGMGGDPAILNKVITGKGFNSARYEASNELNEKLKRQLATTGNSDRKSIVDGIQEIYSTEVPALPLYYPKLFWAHDGRVELYFTLQGIGSGTPIPLNKLSFIK